ncbi:uncharacterized protein LOC142518331 [Primulina tabacum]|uniref:uncharacterized protein LOC142518331 n=1 Tax=Primulina tabacum TaxID=48773 RepID=UPI003F5A7066
MAMEMMKPPANMDFKFDSASTSPYISAPSSPQRFGSFFYSAPASPRVYAAEEGGGDVSVPFDWEEKPGIRKSKEKHITTAASSNYGDAVQDLEEIDFAFNFSRNLERLSLSADELFHGGKIKPLKLPPRFHYEQNHKPTLDSPKSPKKTFRQAFSPRHRKKDSDLDPFAAALEETRKQDFQESYTRGRERSNNSSQSVHKATRSLSPFRVSDLLFDTACNQEPKENPSAISGFSSFWHKKWKIKDLLLFRSASESHATDKEQMRKYSILRKTDSIDVKNSSFRSTDSSSGSVSRRRRSGPPISAHELHYTVNRAVSEDMKKRTFLPYKQGLLGCLRFQPSLFSSDSKKF